MTKTPGSLQDLSKSLYDKAKAEPTWRFWGLYVHVCKMETLQEAYKMAKKNNGAPGIDGVTFEAIEESGTESFLKQIQDELVNQTYRPMRVRKKEIPKDGGTKVRILSIPTIRDRVVQGALKLILAVSYTHLDVYKRQVYRFMSCSFRSVSIRSRLEVGFENRLQNELECSLDLSLIHI